MIIRSLPRKTASFRQLYRYINRDQTLPYSILWNLNTYNPYDQEKIVGQFYENAELLSKGKRRNFLYHEIISMQLASGVSFDNQMKALRDLALKYVQGRGQNLLAYGRMHLEGENLHIHLMLSANELEKNNRHYLSKESFDALKKQCERYLHQQYPELKQPVIFCKERTEKPNKSRQREYEYTRRTGKKTTKQIVKETLSGLLQQERDTSLKEHLLKHNFELYQRGKHVGVVYEGKKYRLGTLGLREAFVESLSRPILQNHAEFQAESNRPNSSNNMGRIINEMKVQDMVMKSIETHIRRLLERRFPESQTRVFRDGKTVSIETSNSLYRVSFTPDELTAWSNNDCERAGVKIRKVLAEFKCAQKFPNQKKVQWEDFDNSEPELGL